MAVKGQAAGSKKTQAQVYCAIGRRKSARARVRIIRRTEATGSSSVVANKRDIKNYLPMQTAQDWALEPLKVTDLFERFDVFINVDGGGVSGQSGAIRLGIARALVEYDESLRLVLRQHGCLTRDARETERKKFGLKKARKREQYSKR